MSLPGSKPKLPVAVDKPTPYTFDLGHLMAEDPNPVELDHSQLEQSLAELARDGAQSLINQLLTTCPLTSTADGVLLSLPQPSTRLPREKPVPVPKPPTKWERFAAKKGIKPKTREQRRNLAFDEATGEWKRKWGYQALNKKGEDDWCVEVNPEDERTRKEGTSIRGDGRRERKERVKRNERKMRKNDRVASRKA
ncbi:ribosomal biogenesis regulatory protein [Thelonectria olida]|uniref:Ribosome biogenesis regulatory protein n=1 Tax=Thelonectria olida TaxID=1576542 RepID=A0A9P8WHX4_9HYPO|nr:ribosomal biogenesis regulatory protein [Thelonectria olida]